MTKEPTSTVRQEVERIIADYTMGFAVGFTDNDGKFTPHRESQRQIDFLREKLSTLLQRIEEMVPPEENVSRGNKNYAIGWNYCRKLVLKNLKGEQ